MVHTLQQLPRVMQVGLLIVIVGAVCDLAYHTAPVSLSGTLDLYLGADGMLAHLVLLIGMVVTLFGVIISRPSRSIHTIE